MAEVGAGGERVALYEALEGLQRLVQAFELRRRQLAEESGLREGQWRVLEEIARQDFMPSLFARRRQCTPAAVSRTLRQLQDRGLVRAAIGAADARQRSYALSPKGLRLLGSLRARREEALDAVWGDLSPGEIQRFGRFSSLLADRLEAYARAVGEGPGASPPPRQRNRGWNVFP